MLSTVLELGADPDGRIRQPRAGTRYTTNGLGMSLGWDRTALMELIQSGPGTSGDGQFGASPTPARRDAYPSHRLKMRADTIARARLLLNSGARADATDTAGMTALHYAARTDLADEFVQLLIAAGADVNARDLNGRTPLDHAVERDLAEMPALLRSLGASSGANVGARK